jgi:hypothetical protein
MSVVEAIETFTNISEDLFSDSKMKPAERNAKLKTHIEKLIEEHSIPGGATLLDAKQYSNDCKL